MIINWWKFRFRNCNMILRTIFCKNQTAWNSFFKNPSFLHILFLLWSIWIPDFFFKFWWLILKLWLIKFLVYFQQKLICWLEEQLCHKLYSQAKIGTQVLFLKIDILWKYITEIRNIYVHMLASHFSHAQ